MAPELLSAAITVDSVRICGSTAGSRARRVVEIERHAERCWPEQRGDLGIPVGPVGLEGGDLLRRTRLQPVARKRHTLVDEAGDAPRRRRVDEDGAALGGNQLVEPGLREAARRRGAGSRLRGVRRLDAVALQAGDREQASRRATRQARPPPCAGPIRPPIWLGLNDHAARPSEEPPTSAANRPAGPTCRPSTQTSQATVRRRSGRPAPAVSVSIQAPGRGRRPTSCGDQREHQERQRQTEPERENHGERGRRRLGEGEADGRRP